MCSPLEILGAVAGPLISSIAGGSRDRDRDRAPTPAPVAPPPQAARAPEPAAVRQQNTALPGGPTSTLLTGTGGVGDDQINRGNVMLGA